MFIQNKVRKHLGKLRTEKKRFCLWEENNKIYYDYNARLIQKVFRGFYERKYTHDYYARMKYLQEIKQKVLTFIII